MMTDLFPYLGKPIIKSIEISLQIESGIGSGWSVSRDLTSFSLVALTHITFNDKIVNVLFHTIRKKRAFDPVIGFGEPGVPSSWCSMKLRKYRGFKFFLFT
jgi:hypothetical protein